MEKLFERDFNSGDKNFDVLTRCVISRVVLTNQSAVFGRVTAIDQSEDSIWCDIKVVIRQFSRFSGIEIDGTRSISIEMRRIKYSTDTHSSFIST